MVQRFRLQQDHDLLVRMVIAYFYLSHIFVSFVYNLDTNSHFYLIVYVGASKESIVNKDDSLNISSIVIGVIAVVIIACLIVVIIFLVKKSRDLKKERLNSQYKKTKRKLDHLMVEKTNMY